MLFFFKYYSLSYEYMGGCVFPGCKLYIVSNAFFLWQAFAQLSESLEPLADGVRRNKEQWLRLAAPRV